MFVYLDFRLGADDHAAAAGFVRLLDAGNAHHNTAGREIRAFDIVHELFRGDFRIVDVGADGVTALPKVVGSHIGGHTHRDSGRSVEQQQGDLGWEDGWLFKTVVIVELHIHGILVKVREDIFRYSFKLGLSVTHCGNGVAVHTSEVTLAEYEGISLVPPLCKTGHCIIYAGISVRMVFSEHVTHYSGGLAGGSLISQAHPVHTEQNPSLHRLEAVPGVRKRP